MYLRIHPLPLRFNVTSDVMFKMNGTSIVGRAADAGLSNDELARLEAWRKLGDAMLSHHFVF